MKLFLDTANLEDIKKWVPTGLIDGITTNPSLLSKEASDVRKNLLEICSLVDGPVSIEVVEKTPEAVYQQALQISELAKNVVVKIPFSFEYLPVIKKLADQGVALNITLVFSVLQALMVAKLNVTMISPFVGRVDDIGYDGIGLIHDIVAMINEYEFDSQVLAASIRTIDHWKQSIAVGADIVTLPPSIVAKAMKHPLTEQGIASFDADWSKLGNASLL